MFQLLEKAVEGILYTTREDRDKNYPQYITSLAGSCLGYSFKVKARILKRTLKDPKKILKLDQKIQEVAHKTSDPDYQKLPHVHSDADVKRLINEIVVKMESTIKEIQSLKDNNGEDIKEKLKELSKKMYRGRYLISLIEKAYRTPRVAKKE